MYEGRIRQFAEDRCAAGTSEARLQGQGGTVPWQGMDKFPNNPNIQTHQSIPKSMWTAGCCVRAGQVLGNNVPQANQIFMSNPCVAQVEQFIRVGANDQTILLFPRSPDCYAADKQFYF